MKQLRTPKKAQKIGQDVDDFDIEEPVQVVLQTTLTARLINLVWTIAGTLIALVILHTLILPNIA